MFGVLLLAFHRAEHHLKISRAVIHYSFKQHEMIKVHLIDRQLDLETYLACVQVLYQDNIYRFMSIGAIEDPKSHNTSNNNSIL